MKPPYVAFSMSEGSELIVSTVSETHALAGKAFEVPLSLSELNDEGLEATAREIGMIVLARLNLWHGGLLKEKFASLYVDVISRPKSLPVSPPRPPRPGASDGEKD